MHKRARLVLSTRSRTHLRTQFALDPSSGACDAGGRYWQRQRKASAPRRGPGGPRRARNLAQLQQAGQLLGVQICGCRRLLLTIALCLSTDMEAGHSHFVCVCVCVCFECLCVCMCVCVCVCVCILSVRVCMRVCVPVGTLSTELGNIHTTTTQSWGHIHTTTTGTRWCRPAYMYIYICTNAYVLN